MLDVKIRALYTISAHKKWGGISHRDWYGNVTSQTLHQLQPDSPEHEHRVLALANRLRKDGVEAWIDQYRPHPDEGWIVWVREQIEQADFAELATF